MDSCGCNEEDKDEDGVCDSIDECPDNPVNSASGICGCDENDSDRDGICDELDVCDVSGSNRFEWIESISINSFNNKSGPNDNGYGFYGQDAITVSAGGLLKVGFNVGHTDAICELSHAIFIDWNKDTDFKIKVKGFSMKGIQEKLASTINYQKNYNQGNM